jgi:nicotinamide riboside transporter PnuC
MISDFFEKHKGARRLTLLWAILLITQTVTSPPEYIAHATAPGAAIITAVIGILVTVIGFYQWSRAQDDKNAGS